MLVLNLEPINSLLFRVEYLCFPVSDFYYIQKFSHRGSCTGVIFYACLICWLPAFNVLYSTVNHVALGIALMD